MLDLLNIKKLAADAGFDLCGVAPCRHLSEGEARFRAWLARGGQSSLGYMERNAEKRFDPRLLVEGARTAVVCAVSYKNAASRPFARRIPGSGAGRSPTRRRWPKNSWPRKPDWAGSDASRCS